MRGMMRIHRGLIEVNSSVFALQYMSLWTVKGKGVAVGELFAIVVEGQCSWKCGLAHGRTRGR